MTADTPSVQKSNFSDWVGDEDEEFGGFRAKQQNRRKKKGKKEKLQAVTWDWDDIYDPTLPNSYADYKGSEEQAREVRDWKARLYYKQLREAKKGEDEKAKPVNRKYTAGAGKRMVADIDAAMFAPPSGISFAPPSFDNNGPAQDENEEEYRPSFGKQRAPKFAPPAVYDDPTGDDAYVRRMQLSGATPATAPAPPVPAPDQADIEAKRAAAQAKIAAFKAKLQQSAPKASPTPPAAVVPPPPPPPPPVEEPQPASTISRAPVRYEVPPPPANVDDDTAMPDATEDNAPRSTRPGQKGFAERLLKKYGWERGKGLGAEESGITTAIVAKAEKRKKLSDAQGGGWAAPANMGKIVGGKKRKVEGKDDDTAGADGALSKVIKLEHMLDGLDVKKEIEEGNLMQEVGEEMGKEYGNVERVFVWREEMGGKNEVFVKFTSALSALRAVKAMEGTTFADNQVKAGFWEEGAFEEGRYG